MPDADYVSPIIIALRALVDAIRDEREARISGEWSDGRLWEADEAIDRLAQLVEGEADPYEGQDFDHGQPDIGGSDG